MNSKRILPIPNGNPDLRPLAQSLGGGAEFKIVFARNLVAKVSNPKSTQVNCQTQP